MIDRNTTAFCIFLGMNFIISLLYLLYGVVILPRRKKDEKLADKKKYILFFVVMVLCPGIGMAFFLFSFLLFHVFFHKEVDLEDVIFSKERVKSHSKGDEEQEKNYVPMEEAIAVTDKENLRNLMLNVLKSDVQNNLYAIALALNSDDSETSHYAASVLVDQINEFSVTVQKIYSEIQKDEDNREAYCCMLIEYMDSVLCQKIFTPMEQRAYVQQMIKVATILFETNYKKITPEYYECICMRLLEIEEIRQCENWCNHAMDQYPDCLSVYTCKLKLYFNTGNKEKFFLVMNQLKQSKIVIDKNTLELIRTFS